MRSPALRGALRALPLAAALCACASVPRPLPAFEAPEGKRLFGIEFGRDRSAALTELRRSGLSVARDPDDEDVLVVRGCAGAPRDGRCRFLFGPAGLYAAELDLAASEGNASGWLEALRHALGAPATPPGPAAPQGGPAVIATWERPGWTIALTRLEPGAGSAATLRAEYDAATPPVVAGVPLARRRAPLEALLEQKGVLRVQREDDATTFLACPAGDAEAHACVIAWRADRAASVTEIYGGFADDGDALAEFRRRASDLGKEIGREPRVECPESGPDRVAGDCTATWAGDRLIVVVGAHRNAGARHRGGISVYTLWAYPPLVATTADAAPAAEGPPRD